MLSPEEIDIIIDKVKETAKPDKIYLFGSYALGKATEQSDLDLLVIDNSSRNKNTLALKISKSLFPRNFGLDLVITSAKELKEKNKLTFWREITTRGKIVYERD